MPPVSVRVAAAQFAVGSDRDANLAAVLRAIAAAAGQGAALVVLPEFCNHLSWYEDRRHALREACVPGDAFLTEVAAAAPRHRLYVKLHVTLATPATRPLPGRTDGMRISAASLLLAPDGTLAGRADKQTLMGSENDHLDPAETAGPVVETRLGPVGLYSCMEGVINEVCRSLSLRGAQLLLNSLNSFALDEASLHIPVRAAENKVWVIAANKVGPLIPGTHLAAVAAGLGVPPEALHGAGESQIVAPDGTVAARAPRTGEALAVADITPGSALDKQRPDGTHVFTARRPDLYGPIARSPRPVPAFGGRRADSVSAAVLRPSGTGVAAVKDAARLAAEAASRGARLLVLPELFFFADGRVPAREVGTPAQALGAVALRALAEALRGTHALVACTVPEGPVHLGVLTGADGPVLRVPQLNPSARHASWATLRPGPPGVHDATWGRIALVTGDDSVQPETFRLAALAGADTVAVCFTGLEPWESALGLPERSAENRLNVVAAGHGQGAVHALPADFGLWQSREGRFTGRISHPRTTTAAWPVTSAEIHPVQALRRLVSRSTDLVDGRPWRLSGALTAPHDAADAPVAHPA
jgi:predicted amidohydrolase